jgi:hypothetical protein
LELTIDGLLGHPEAGHDRLTTTTTYLDTSSGGDHYA